MDETYFKVAGQWKYLYHAVDRDGHTVDFLLRAINLHGMPEKITIDKSDANMAAAIQSIQIDSGVDIEMRQIKYLNNIARQDHRPIKRVVRPRLGRTTFRCARALIAESQKRT